MNTAAHHTPARLAALLAPRPVARDDHARLLAESLPFVKAMHGQTVVIACLGALAFDPAQRQILAKEAALLSLMGLRPVLVHGGAPQFQVTQGTTATDLPQRAAIQVCRAAMQEINVELVRLLCREGVHAVGVNGQDLHAMRADATPGEAFDAEYLSLLQSNGIVPVVMPLVLDADFNHVLQRPEQMGSTLARQLAAHAFLMVSAGDALRSNGIADGMLGRADLQDWLANHDQAPLASEIRAALDALNHGVQTVHLIDDLKPGALVAELLTNEGAGTTICRRTGPQMLAETARYFQDCDSQVRADFTIEKKRVVRF